MTHFDPRRIVIASSQVAWHGGETQAALLAEGLRDRGLSCHILARRGGKFGQRMRARDFDVTTFPGRGLSPFSLFQLRQTLKRLQPDLLLLNDGHALRALGLAGFGQQNGLRVAIRRVDFPIRWPTKFTRFADGVICVSHAVAQVCRHAGLRNAFLRVVHDGVDPAFAESGDRETGRMAMGVREEGLALLCIAKLTDHKGHRFLLQAMPQILASHPKLTLNLAGDGELRQPLMDLSERLGLDKRVRFLGYRTDIPDLLAAADIVVQPSHLEGLCSSLIDAMLAEKAIVATRAGGIPDLFASKTPVGRLVPAKSPGALATAVIQLAGEPQTRANLGQAARQHAGDHFTHDIMVNNTLNACRSFAALVDSSQWAA